MAAALASQTSETTVSSVDCSDDDDDDIELDYYNDEDGIDLDSSSPSTTSTDPEWYSFKCLNHEEVQLLVNDHLQSLSSKHHIDISTALTVLQDCNWNNEHVEKKVKMDYTHILHQLHVIPNEQATHILPNDLCAVCFNNFDNKYDQLKCGHIFCTSCWETYIICQVKQGHSIGIECMVCSVLVPVETLEMILAPFEDIYKRYSHLKITEIVVSHPMYRLCPGVDCDMIFTVDIPQAKRVTCSSCKTSICFLCGEEYHCPTECEPFKKWLVKCRDDSETFNYISANTKDCPKCRTSIEKNGGCNHINCSRCNHDFCWMCLEDWSVHCGEYYECSRYKTDPDKYKDKSSRERSALQKYLFYYERWKNHHQSLLLEEETRQKISDHIEVQVSNSKGTWIDWQYLLDAASLLKKCRYTLKYTYPRAYWMDGDRKQLFEYQQAQLELEIENLSWKVERATITDRAELERQMAITEIRRTTLLKDFIIL